MSHNDADNYACAVKNSRSEDRVSIVMTVQGTIKGSQLKASGNEDKASVRLCNTHCLLR